jgi:NhaP-type Na+/H+ or K+/H+ antiporter
MYSTLLAIGILVFVSHFLSLTFRRTQIPDVLVLMLLGLLLGPVLGVVTAEDFGKIGSVLATIALVVILFESGTSLRLDVVARSLGTTAKLTFGCFVLTTAVVSVVGWGWFGLPESSALLLGIILGGTSSAVVIPMVQTLRLGHKASAVLVLESALTDVLCILGVVAMLQALSGGLVEPGRVVGGVLASLLFAVLLGVLGGIGWLLILGKVRDFPNTISSTIAYAFIVYGCTEFLGFSGAVAAMALGITLTNFERMGLNRLHWWRREVVPLTSADLAFFQESVFLLKTYFFVYLGISIQFQGWEFVAIALVMVLMVYLLRLLLVRHVFAPRDYSLRDASYAAFLAPKGLAAAVLATVPMQHGIAGAEVIRDVTYMVILVSIVLSAVLAAVYPATPVRKVFARCLGKAEPSSPPPAQ